MLCQKDLTGPGVPFYIFQGLAAWDQSEYQKQRYCGIALCRIIVVGVEEEDFSGCVTEDGVCIAGAKEEEYVFDFEKSFLLAEDISGVKELFRTNEAFDVEEEAVGFDDL